MKTPRILAFLLLSVLSFSQVNVAPLVPPIVLGPDFAGAKIYTYVSGTTTPLATYQDSAGTILNSNPVILDANGIGRVFVKAQSYKIVLKSALDVTILTLDNLTTLAVLGKPFLSDTLANRPTSCTATVTFFVQTDSPYTLFQCNSTGTGWNALVPTWAPSAIGTAGQQLTVNSGATAAAWQSKPVIDVRDKGAVCDGTTDDSTAIQAAITAVATTGGTVLIPGKCAFSTALNAAQSNSVTLQGMGSNAVGYGARPSAQLIWTGIAGAARAIDARSSNAFTFRNLALVLKTQLYSGIGIDLSHDASAVDASLFTIENFYIAGDNTTDRVAGHTDQSSALILLDKAILGKITNGHLTWAQRGIQGINTAAHYSNGMTISAVELDNLRVSGITDAVDGWTFTGIYCEGIDGTTAPPTHGMPFCYKDENLATGTTAFTWIGGWVGDAVNVGTAWFQFNGGAGITFLGANISNPYFSDIKFLAQPSTLTIIGGSIGGASPPIDLNSVKPLSMTITGVDFSNSPAPLIGGFTCPTRSSSGYLQVNVFGNFAASGLTPASCLFTATSGSSMAMESGGFTVGGVTYGPTGFTATGADIVVTTGATGAAGSIALNAGTGGIALAAGGAGVVSAAPFKATAYSATNLLSSSTAPTISSGFGSSPSIASDNGTAAFTINVGTGGTASAGVIGLPTAATGWNCMPNNITATAANRGDQRTVQTASSTTTATIQNQTISTGAALVWTASDIIRVSCFAY